MTRLETLRREWLEKLEEFGSPEYNHAQRRALLQQLRDLEQEIDKQYSIMEE